MGIIFLFIVFGAICIFGIIAVGCHSSDKEVCIPVAMSGLVNSYTDETKCVKKCWPKTYKYLGHEIKTSTRNALYIAGNYLNNFGLPEKSVAFYDPRFVSSIIRLDDFIGDFLVIDATDNTMSRMNPFDKTNVSFNGYLVRKCVGFIENDGNHSDEEIKEFVEEFNKSFKKNDYIKYMKVNKDNLFNQIKSALDTFADNKRFVITVRQTAESLFCSDNGYVFEIYPTNSIQGRIEHLEKASC